MPNCDDAQSPALIQAPQNNVDARDGDLAPSEDLVDPSRVWQKMDLVVLPVTTMMFFLSSLDRSNIGNAQVAGLKVYLGITNEEFSAALIVTLVPYVLVGFPSNLLFKIIGPRLLLPSMVVLWGLTCAFQGFVHSFIGLASCRGFLGLFEGGLLPGLALYLSLFYPRRNLQFRIAIMFSATSVASGFSGLLAAAIMKMDGIGGKPGWAWLFILEGGFTVIFGLAAFFLLPNSPTSAPLFTNAERAYISRVLDEDGNGIVDEEDDSYTWAECIRTFRQPHVALLGLAGFFSGATLSGLAYFLPTIVSSLGYEGGDAQLMSVPPFVASALLSVVSSVLSDYYGRRGWTIVIFGAVSAVGFAVFIGSFVDVVRYGSLFLLVPGTHCIAPPLGAWMANNSSPQIRRATALALLHVTTNVGAVVSTWLLGMSTPPRFLKGSITLFVFQFGIITCAVTNLVWLTRENRGKVKAGAMTEQTPLVSPPGRAAGKVGDDSPSYRYSL